MSTSQERIKDLVNEMEALINEDPNVSILMVATIAIPDEKNNTYNYNFYMHGDVDNIEEALINRLADNVLEEDGTLYASFKSIIDDVDELIVEPMSKQVIH